MSVIFFWSELTLYLFCIWFLKHLGTCSRWRLILLSTFIFSDFFHFWVRAFYYMIVNVATFGYIYWRNPYWETSFFVQRFKTSQNLEPLHLVYFNTKRLPAKLILITAVLWNARCALELCKISMTEPICKKFRKKKNSLIDIWNGPNPFGHYMYNRT